MFQITDMRCEFASNSLGIDIRDFRRYWNTRNVGTDGLSDTGRFDLRPA